MRKGRRRSFYSWLVTSWSGKLGVSYLSIFFSFVCLTLLVSAIIFLFMALWPILWGALPTLTLFLLAALSILFIVGVIYYRYWWHKEDFPPAEYHHLKQLSNLFGFDCSDLTIHNSIKEIEKVNKAINNKFKYVVICPGGNWKPKLWPVKNFNKIIKIINKEFNNVKFIITGSMSEKKYFYENVIKDINKEMIINLMGESLTLTSAYMKKCNLFIGNDSGLMHVAVATDVPTFCISGPTDVKKTGPYGSDSYIIHSDIDCLFCYNYNTVNFSCPLNIDYKCLKEFYPAEVFKEISPILSNILVNKVYN